ncbi:MAG: 4-phosphoerythronate dehydrogenase [Bacteroidales bacterium]|nr:4-phosphoerythronate dehydrogenase [Candidatus Cacconaster merdequi]
MSKIGKIVADRAIPFLEGVLEPYFDVDYLSGDAISRDDLKDAVALLVRTRTECNSHLLSGTPVRLVATATIGTDHIDSLWCSLSGIRTVSAPGCNSGGVCQYVFAALSALDIRPLSSDGRIRTLGVIGVGHVGSKVAAKGRELGFNVLENDPPRSLGLPLDELLSSSDIVTLHIPLEGNRDFAGYGFFEKIRSGACFINASRGEVVVDEALLQARNTLGRIVLDVWRNEPELDRRMLDAADIATPHIAGYSIQGKANGTTAVVRAVGETFGIPELAKYTVPLTLPAHPQAYDILADDRALRTDPASFEALRNHYAYRDETVFHTKSPVK